MLNAIATLLGWSLGLLALGAAGLCGFTFWLARRIDAMLPPEGHFIDVPGARLHVRDEGDGPAIVFVHGLGGQMGHYTYRMTGLLNARFRTVAIDRPGSGHSPRKPGTAADLSTQAACVAALIGEMRLERPLVVGHSFGGAVALALALEHPERVGGLALLAPLTHMVETVPPVFRTLTVCAPLARRLLAWTVAIPRAIVLGRATALQVFGPDAVPRDYALRGGALLGLRPGAWLAACADLHAIPERLPQLQLRYHELRIPISILCGKDDRILDWREQGRSLVDQVRGARLELVEGGHMLPVTNPAACTAFVERAAGALRHPAARRTA